MPKAIRIHETGGPEKMIWEDVEVGQPGPGEIRICHTAVGLNYIDVYHRTGLYPNPGLPCSIGSEGAGVIEAVGEGVTDLKVGQRAAYGGGPIGSYSQCRIMPANFVVPLPDNIDDQTAAAMMLQGLTAWYLLRRVYRVTAGETVLAHAAAGGVGLILCQWAKHLGATVIGTVGSDEKAKLAADNGCDHTIVYTRENIAERVRDLTDGKGVAVVYDSVGMATFEASLDSLQRFGMLVSFGNASGPVPPVSLLDLMRRGSLYVTRPTLAHYCVERADILAGAEELFDVVGNGHVKMLIGQTYPLQDAAQAHIALESRQTVGSTILLP